MKKLLNINISGSIDVGAKQIWKQVMKYLGFDQPLLIPVVSTVRTEEVVSTGLLKPTARKKIEFKTRRPWELMVWK
jgi:hypothetical protein